MPIQFEEKEIDQATAAALTTQTLVEGATVATWWRRQANDFVEAVMDEVAKSVVNGETTAQATTRIVGGTVDGVEVPGIANTSRRKASALASTAINAITSAARLKTFEENSSLIKGVQQVSTLDNKTSDICIAYSGQAWDIQTQEPLPGSTLPFNGGTPRHFNCRSTLVPIVKSFREMGIDIDEFDVGTRASMDGQVPGDITFDQWLRGKNVRFQDDLLGKTRARLWRENKITLTQLVDMRGDPLTVRQLEQRVGRRHH